MGYAVSNHPTDTNEGGPAWEHVPAELGVVAAAYDAGFWKEANVPDLEDRGIDPYIATGRAGHHRDWQDHFEPGTPAEPGPAATALERMGYKLRTELGKLIDRGRKCSVEPVFGIIKEALGFRQFSLRGLAKVAGEWCLVCLGYNLKRLHSLRQG